MLKYLVSFILIGPFAFAQTREEFIEELKEQQEHTQEFLRFLTLKSKEGNPQTYAEYIAFLRGREETLYYVIYRLKGDLDF